VNRLRRHATDAAAASGPGFTPAQREATLALATAFFPQGHVLAGAGPATVERLQSLLLSYGPGALRAFVAGLRLLEISTLPGHRTRFSRLPPHDRERVLQRWLNGNPLQRTLLMTLGLMLKHVQFDDPEVFRTFGCVYDRSAKQEPARWMQQVTRGEDLAGDDIECDVVVVGTGAGGAVTASVLAEAGLAVVMVEEGEFFTREHFTGRARDAMTRLYRTTGEMLALGNAAVLIPTGKTVGGTTTINSGTCFRAPDRVLDHWHHELGLEDFAPSQMAPYFEKVEAVLGVAEAKAQHLGGAARVVARGAERLGWSHHALRRNAPDCDGQGVCVFGCPSGAKRSTNVSYVPRALQHAAMLITGVRAERVMLEGGRAAGIEMSVGAASRRVRVRSRAVVLACGALLTPAFLLRQGLLRGNAHLGRHLTIHPTVAATGMFDEELRSFEGIPQGYCVDEFGDEGILLEGGTASIDAAASVFNLAGHELMDVMEHYDHAATFGAMVCEREGPGRVRVLPGGRTFVQYWIDDELRRRMQTALVRIGEILFAAGASRVYPTIAGRPPFDSLQDLRAFAQTPTRARNFLLTAYHPLGTCRIGASPASSVLDPHHQAHGLPGLYVCDASALPGSPEVNPQITIMAMATRAAENLASHLK